MNFMSIEVLHLSKSYGQSMAIQDLSFDLKMGQITGFLGPNGAGKTTTLKILMGLEPPTQGTAKILGLDVRSDGLMIKKQIGYLAENNPLYPEMYIKEFLTFIGKIHGIASKELSIRIKEVIELVGLEREQKKKIKEVSKGYQQRVGIAQAILHNPNILILDEPTSGLDPNQMEEIRSLITTLKKDKTILFSSHLLGEVNAICDHILLIDKGQLKANCHIEEAKNYPGGLEAFFKEKTN
jgi:ABC-2 type transport system ATP-binding protein